MYPAWIKWGFFRLDVVGNTYGDALKYVTGPSRLIFMKLFGMTSLLIAPQLTRMTAIFH